MAPCPASLFYSKSFLNITLQINMHSVLVIESQLLLTACRVYFPGIEPQIINRYQIIFSLARDDQSFFQTILTLEQCQIQIRKLLENTKFQNLRVFSLSKLDLLELSQQLQTTDQIQVCDQKSLQKAISQIKTSCIFRGPFSLISHFYRLSSLLLAQYCPIDETVAHHQPIILFPQELPESGVSLLRMRFKLSSLVRTSDPKSELMKVSKLYGLTIMVIGEDNNKQNLQQLRSLKQGIKFLRAEYLVGDLSSSPSLARPHSLFLLDSSKSPGRLQGIQVVSSAEQVFAKTKVQDQNKWVQILTAQQVDCRPVHHKCKVTFRKLTQPLLQLFIQTISFKEKLKIFWISPIQEDPAIDRLRVRTGQEVTQVRDFEMISQSRCRIFCYRQLQMQQALRELEKQKWEVERVSFEEQRKLNRLAVFQDYQNFSEKELLSLESQLQGYQICSVLNLNVVNLKLQLLYSVIKFFYKDAFGNTLTFVSQTQHTLKELIDLQSSADQEYTQQIAVQRQELRLSNLQKLCQQEKQKLNRLQAEVKQLQSKKKMLNTLDSKQTQTIFVENKALKRRPSLLKLKSALVDPSGKVSFEKEEPNALRSKKSTKKIEFFRLSKKSLTLLHQNDFLVRVSNRNRSCRQQICIFGKSTQVLRLKTQIQAKISQADLIVVKAFDPNIVSNLTYKSKILIFDFELKSALVTACNIFWQQSCMCLFWLCSEVPKQQTFFNQTPNLSGIFANAELLLEQIKSNLIQPKIKLNFFRPERVMLKEGAITLFFPNSLKKQLRSHSYPNILLFEYNQTDQLLKLISKKPQNATIILLQLNKLICSQLSKSSVNIILVTPSADSDKSLLRQFNRLVMVTSSVEEAVDFMIKMDQECVKDRQQRFKFLKKRLKKCTVMLTDEARNRQTTLLFNRLQQSYPFLDYSEQDSIQTDRQALILLANDSTLAGNLAVSKSRPMSFVVALSNNPGSHSALFDKYPCFLAVSSSIQNLAVRFKQYIQIQQILVKPIASTFSRLTVVLVGLDQAADLLQTLVSDNNRFLLKQISSSLQSAKQTLSDQFWMCESYLLVVRENDLQKAVSLVDYYPANLNSRILVLSQTPNSLQTLFKSHSRVHAISSDPYRLVLESERFLSDRPAGGQSLLRTENRRATRGSVQFQQSIIREFNQDQFRTFQTKESKYNIQTFQAIDSLQILAQLVVVRLSSLLRNQVLLEASSPSLRLFVLAPVPLDFKSLFHKYPSISIITNKLPQLFSEMEEYLGSASNDLVKELQRRPFSMPKVIFFGLEGQSKKKKLHQRLSAKIPCLISQTLGQGEIKGQTLVVFNESFKKAALKVCRSQAFNPNLRFLMLASNPQEHEREFGQNKRLVLITKSVQKLISQVQFYCRERQQLNVGSAKELPYIAKKRITSLIRL